MVIAGTVTEGSDTVGVLIDWDGDGGQRHGDGVLIAGTVTEGSVTDGS